MNEKRLIEECLDGMACYPFVLYTPNEIRKGMKLLLKRYKLAVLGSSGKVKK